MVITAEGAARCRCWHDARRTAFYDSVPKEFKNSSLATAKADTSRHPNQTRNLAAIRNAPFDSYIFVGPNGAGKSWCAWLLAMNAFDSGRRVITIDLDTLLKQYRSYEFNDGVNPAIMAEDLMPRRAGERRTPVTIFIDEIAATNPTEYAAKEFFQLLKAAGEFEHQVLLTCNISLEELQVYWAKKGEPAVSNSIMRRITDYMKLVEFE